MRPDEWATTDIGRWNEAMEIRIAYQNGVEDANQQLKADKAAKASIEKMKAR